MKLILVLESGKSIRNKIIDREKDLALIEPEVFYDLTRLPDTVPNLVIADLTSIKKEKVELLMNLKIHPILSMVPFLLIVKEHSHLFNEQLSITNYYIRKPVSKDQLSKLINKILTSTEIVSPW